MKSEALQVEIDEIKKSKEEICIQNNVLHDRLKDYEDDKNSKARQLFIYLYRY